MLKAAYACPAANVRHTLCELFTSKDVAQLRAADSRDLLQYAETRLQWFHTTALAVFSSVPKVHLVKFNGNLDRRIANVLLANAKKIPGTNCKEDIDRASQELHEVLKGEVTKLKLGAQLPPPIWDTVAPIRVDGEVATTPMPKVIKYEGVNPLETQDTFQAYEVHERLDFMTFMAHDDQTKARRDDCVRAHVIDAVLRCLFCGWCLCCFVHARELITFSSQSGLCSTPESGSLRN